MGLLEAGTIVSARALGWQAPGCAREKHNSHKEELGGGGRLLPDSRSQTLTSSPARTQVGPTLIGQRDTRRGDGAETQAEDSINSPEGHQPC